MGKVRIKIVKRLGRELVEKYPDLFSRDFNHNKKQVNNLLEIKSKKLRNQIAGYITHLIKLREKQQKGKEEQSYTEEWEQ